LEAVIVPVKWSGAEPAPDGEALTHPRLLTTTCRDRKALAPTRHRANPWRTRITE
jgi:hypothetical protein